MTKRHTVGCSFPPCEYRRRKSWCYTCARHRGEPEKPVAAEPACPHCVNGIRPMSSQLCDHCHPVLR